MNTYIKLFNKPKYFLYNQISIETLKEKNTNPMILAPKVNIFERREQMEQIANKLLKGAKSTVAMKVFHFFLSKADNDSGISRHSIKSISQYINYGKQWTQEGISLCAKVGLITRVRRGIKKTNIYIINYELLGKHSYKSHKCSEGVSVARQSTLNESNNSITSRNASFEKDVLGKDFSLENSKNNPNSLLEPVLLSTKEYLTKETLREYQASTKDYQYHKLETIRKEWRHDPTNRKEELEFFKEFKLSKKSNRILENSVFNKYWVTSEYRQAYKCYIENNKPPFEEYGEFWNHRNVNRYFPLWLRGTIKRKKEVESQGKTFFHYHNRQAYKKAEPYLKAKKFGRKIDAKPEVVYNRGKNCVKNEQMKDEGIKQEFVKVIEQEPDKLRQKILMVCARILPGAMFLLAEKNMKIVKVSEDSDEVSFCIYMKYVYTFEILLEGALERELSTNEKRAYVRVRVE